MSLWVQGQRSVGDRDSAPENLFDLHFKIDEQKTLHRLQDAFYDTMQRKGFKGCMSKTWMCFFEVNWWTIDCTISSASDNQQVLLPQLTSIPQLGLWLVYSATSTSRSAGISAAVTDQWGTSLIKNYSFIDFFNPCGRIGDSEDMREGGRGREGERVDGWRVYG